jgi:hypothetical protein
MPSSQKRKPKMSRAEINRLTSYWDDPFSSADTKRRHLREKRKSLYEELTRVRNGFISAKGSAAAHRLAYERAAKSFRARIAITPIQREEATKKLQLLQKIAHPPLRVDLLERILSEMGKKDAFADKEAAFDKEGTTPWFVFGEKASPEDVAGHFYWTTAHQITQSGRDSKYAAVAYFDKAAFDPRHEYGGHLWYKWGRIRDIGRNPIVAIQIMHADPRVLFQATKSMLKRRPRDPIPIIDIFGHVFFP